MREQIIENRHQFSFITCLEAGVNWLHFDVRNLEPDAPKNAIMLVYPGQPNRDYV
jgi:hypothetical protein